MSSYSGSDEYNQFLLEINEWQKLCRSESAQFYMCLNGEFVIIDYKTSLTDVFRSLMDYAKFNGGNYGR